jgi:hypothetical protein
MIERSSLDKFAKGVEAIILFQENPYSLKVLGVSPDVLLRSN